MSSRKRINKRGGALMVLLRACGLVGAALCGRPETE